MSFLSNNLLNIKPSPTIAVSTKAAQLKSEGKKIISLAMGEPDFNTPDNIKNAAIRAIEENITRYTPVDGLPLLKEAIINKFKKQNNLDYNNNEITVGCGAKQVIYNAFMATLNKNDEVIIPSPYWVSYPDMVLLAGGVPVIAETNLSNNFKLTADILEKYITNKTKWIIINSPSNPTGSCYNYEELKEIFNLVNKYDHIHILSDDIYEHILFDNQKFYNILNIANDLDYKDFKEKCLIINGVSKAYSMTGWRIGYGAGNKDLIKAISKIQSQSTSNPSSISQMAAIEALNGDQSYISKSLNLFKERRDMLCDKLNNIKYINVNKTDGAFYLFPSCSELFGKKTQDNKIINNSNDFASYLLEYALVAVVPGIAFGSEGFFRISYAASYELLENAANKIKEACDSLI